LPKQDKKNLRNLKQPTIFKRDPVEREFRESLRGESAGKAIGEIKPGCEIFGFTKGQFSIIDVIRHCLGCTGPADVFIATWSVAAGDIKAAHKFLEDGRIRTIRFLIDYSFQSRKPKFCQELRSVFGADVIRVTVTHAKYIMIRNENWNLVIRTSMNLNYNPRYENFEISDSFEFAEFQQRIIDEIWNSQEAAEGFGNRPAVGENFKKNFTDQTSIFGANLKDGRDLL